MSKKSQLEDLTRYVSRLGEEDEKIANRVQAAANSVEQSYAYIQVAYKEAVDLGHASTGLLLFDLLEPITKVENRLKQMANLMEREDR